MKYTQPDQPDINANCHVYICTLSSQFYKHHMSCVIRYRFGNTVNMFKDTVIGGVESGVKNNFRNCFYVQQSNLFIGRTDLSKETTVALVKLEEDSKLISKDYK